MNKKVQEYVSYGLPVLSVFRGDQLLKKMTTILDFKVDPNRKELIFDCGSIVNFWDYDFSKPDKIEAKFKLYKNVGDIFNPGSDMESTSSVTFTYYGYLNVVSPIKMEEDLVVFRYVFFINETGMPVKLI